MPGRRHPDGDAVDLDCLAIFDGLAALGEFLAIARFHDGKRFRRGENGAMPRACVVGMAMRHHGAVDGATHRVDIEIAGRAIEPLRRGMEKQVGSDHR